MILKQNYEQMMERFIIKFNVFAKRTGRNKVYVYRAATLESPASTSTYTLKYRVVYHKDKIEIQGYRSFLLFFKKKYTLFELIWINGKLNPKGMYVSEVEPKIVDESVENLESWLIAYMKHCTTISPSIFFKV